jgi:hypothetical protein
LNREALNIPRHDLSSLEQAFSEGELKEYSFCIAKRESSRPRWFYLLFLRKMLVGDQI